MKGVCAFASTKPFCNTLGSGTFKMVLKFFVLSVDRWILICDTASKVFVQLIKILFVPLVVTVKFGKVSCAREEPEKQVNKKKTASNLFMSV